MKSSVFKRYYKKIALQGLLKSFLLSLIISFICLAIVSLLLWIFGNKSIWIGFVGSGGLLLVLTPVLYFIFFRPDTKEIATRIDECGLEERMITMTELDGDDSFIARMQREDAIKALNTVDSKLLKFTLSMPFVIALCVSSILGVSATVLDGLYKAEVINPGNEIINDLVHNDAKSYTINYTVSDGGVIDGDLFQVVEEGKDSSLIVAVPDDGFVFVRWTDEDGNELGDDPSRIETNVTTDMSFIAVFEEPNGNDGDPGEEGDPGEDGNGEGDSGAENQPSDPSNSSSSNENSQSGNPGSGAGSDKTGDNRKVIDGQQDCGGENYNEGKSNSDNELNQNGSISKDGSDVASGYMNGMKN